ncbi:MAG: polysaccharide deacetylase family protein [Bryobacteraceae bacterium]|jgi:peptidoglycan/xylan/chitin deacetylase (PgdA/CDA1 family)
MIAEGAGLLLAAGGVLAWGARARSAQLFCPSVWRGPKSRRALALTFDDGPSESTLDLLSLLHTYGVRATFFQLGHHARRLPRTVRRCVEEGHEIGNHTDRHHGFWLRGPQFIREEIERAQESLARLTGAPPRLFRAPYGVRWFGMRGVLRELGLKHVAWTVLARDYTLDAEGVVAHVAPRVSPGAILCFHDGRELRHSPDISSTLGALERLLPRWLEDGYEFLTVSEMLALPGGSAAP